MQHATFYPGSFALIVCIVKMYTTAVADPIVIYSLVYIAELIGEQLESVVQGMSGL